MKRQAIAVLIGSLFALPAFANNEIDPGYASPTTFVNDHAGWTFANAEQGYVVASRQDSGKSRAEVLAELSEAQRAGDFVVNGELGLKANELYPSRYAASGEVVASK